MWNTEVGTACLFKRRETVNQGETLKEDLQRNQILGFSELDNEERKTDRHTQIILL